MKRTVETIRRLAPSDGKLIFEAEEGTTCTGFSPESLGNGLYEIRHLRNDVDYEITFTGRGGSSCTRKFRCGSFPGTVINYIHPEDRIFYPSGMCPASPSIIELKNGRLLVSHDIFYHDMAQNLSMVFYSDDLGGTWHLLSLVEGCFWGKLFIYNDSLFMIANMHEYGDLVLYESPNLGKSWEKACTILDGGNKYTGGPHKAPMPVVEHAGRIWTAVEFGSWTLGGHSCGYISASGDIRNRANWIVSGFTEYDSSWEGTVEGDSSGCIEGNILVKPDGRMVDFLRYGIAGCRPDRGKALYLEIDTGNPSSAPCFGKVVDFPGNHSKFTVKYDGKTGRYWTISNRAETGSPVRRNELVLASSEDVDNWRVEKVLLDYEHNGWHENHGKAGFQYIDFIFHDNHIFYVSRTALNGALNFHDSNCITFHKVRYR